MLLGVQTTSHPDGWTREPLSALGKWGSGGTPSRKNAEYYGGDIPWIKIGDLRDGPVKEIEECISEAGLVNSSASLLPTGTLLLAMYGASIGKLGFVTVPAATNQAIASFQAFDHIDPQFVFYFLLHLKPHLIALGQGGAQPNISQTIIKQVEMAYPTIDVQRRIVARIEELFGEIEAGEQELAAAKADLGRYRRAVLKAAVTGELTRDWREQNPPNETGADLLARILAQGAVSKGKPVTSPHIRKEDLPEVPEGWCWASLAQVAAVSGGVTKNSKRQQLALVRPYLRVANVYAGRFDLNEVKTIGVEEGELARVSLRAGDLLFVEGNGSPDQIGRAAVWNGEIEDCVHQNHLIKARFREDVIAEWAMIWFMSPMGRDLILSVASSTSGLYTLSISKIAGLSLPIPPTHERREIVARVSELLSVGTETDEAIAQRQIEAARLRQSVLAAAFSGRLVAQSAPATTKAKRRHVA